MQADSLRYVICRPIRAGTYEQRIKKADSPLWGVGLFAISPVNESGDRPL